MAWKGDEGNQERALPEGFAQAPPESGLLPGDPGGGIRPEKVQLARWQIRSGYYDRPEVRDLLVRSLLHALGFDR